MKFLCRRLIPLIVHFLEFKVASFFVGLPQIPSQPFWMAKNHHREVMDRQPLNQSKWWRLSHVEVSISNDDGKDSCLISQGVLTSLMKKLKQAMAHTVTDMRATPKPVDIQLVRKSFDGRRINRNGSSEPVFVYVLDLSFKDDVRMSQKRPMTSMIQCLTTKPINRSSRCSYPNHSFSYEKSNHQGLCTLFQLNDEKKNTFVNKTIDQFCLNQNISVTVVGSGPAGLTAALTLAEAGCQVVVLERGENVENRGKHIGALLVKKKLNPESNFCFGEGGAGTWSDGKLFTRIGHNSEQAKTIIEMFVRFGAPESIITDSRPHIGTDRMVAILKKIRKYLESLNVQFKFGHRVEEILFSDQTPFGNQSSSKRSVIGLRVSTAIEQDGQRLFHTLNTSNVILAVGHSSREMYVELARVGVAVEPKPFAMGLRIEHLQSTINKIKYHKHSNLTSDDRGRRGLGKIPVADYQLRWTETKNNRTDSVYSFCMCPGGQIVTTSIEKNRVCINGMSFSKRNSRWANSGIVVPISIEACKKYLEVVSSTKNDSTISPKSALIGLEFQELIEAKAAHMGGGNLAIPVQRVSDFLIGRGLPPNEVLPKSSYQLGVTPARLDLLFPKKITKSLRTALFQFEKQMPGFITCPSALLHGVESRTSSPVKIKRHLFQHHWFNCFKSKLFMKTTNPQQHKTTIGLPFSKKIGELNQCNVIGDSSSSFNHSCDSTIRPFECDRIKGLWPCGEGAGYAGGIMSAAVDGRNVATALVISEYNSLKY